MKPVGLAPIAARSLKLTAAEYQPNCSYVMPAGKCLSKDTMSDVTTVPSLRTAASSPGPTIPSGWMKLRKSSISFLSPMSPIMAIGKTIVGETKNYCPGNTVRQSPIV